jgi:hypothetical protein
MDERALSIALLVIAIILLALGGLADICGGTGPCGMSKYHLWADGLAALILSVWVLLWGHTERARGKQ